jgi:hypothetical protein
VVLVLVLVLANKIMELLVLTEVQVLVTTLLDSNRKQQILTMEILVSAEAKVRIEQ